MTSITKLGNVAADLNLQLTSEIAIGGTSSGLASVLDDDGVTLPDGYLYLTLDGSNSQKEHVYCTLNKSTKVISDIKSVSRQGVLTAGVVRRHKVGATVEITDHATLYLLNEIVRGNTALDATKPIKYDTDPSITDDKELATKKYADGIVSTLDGNVVHDTGNETVGGIKTFSSSPIVPTPTTDMQASTKKYGDDTFLSKSGGTLTGKIVSSGSSEVGKTYTPATGSQTVALDCALNNIHIVTGHASGTAITFTVANATNSQVFIVSILQGAVVSTIAGWFSTIRWVGGSAPTLTASANKRDTFGFIRTGANTYDGFIIGQNC